MHEFLVEQIVAATKDVFETMLGVSVTAGPGQLETSDPGATDGVSALVGIAGKERWSGTGCIGCGTELACKVAEWMLAGKYTAINDEVLDAMGEIANMVIGNVKNGLEERLGSLGLSIPTVIYGHNFCTRSVAKKGWTVVPFEVDGIRFHVKLMLTEHADKLAQSHGAEAMQPAVR